jgi:hypothetical protein
MESQNWDSIRGGLPNNFLQTVVYDSVHNELLVSGPNMYKIGSLPARGIARWNGVRWDSLAGGLNTHDKLINPNLPSAYISSCVPYNGKLLVAGTFISIGGIPATGLALWDGVKWDSLPKRAFRYNIFGGTVCYVKKINGKIYIHGQFDTIAGQKASGLALWDGVNFTPIQVPLYEPDDIVIGVEEFQGDLYIAGGYFTIAGTYTSQADVLKYDGTTWTSTTGTGFLAPFSGPRPLKVYNNELYTAGHFLMSYGDKGNNIMKFNGSQWQDLGFGPSQDNIYDIIFHNNRLWAIGVYWETAYMPCFAISVYDGTKWCALQDTLNGLLTSGTIYNDTIYVGGGFTNAGGDPHIARLAKIRDENLYRNCNGVGIEELEISKAFTIYPNPVSNILHIESEQYFEAGTEIEITNTLGQTVLKRGFNKEVDLTTLPSGYYTLKVVNPNNPSIISKFVKTR